MEPCREKETEWTRESFGIWCQERRERLRNHVPPLPLGNLPYAKNAIEMDGARVTVVRWPAQAACLPHDHGNTSGFVCILEGSMLEERLWPAPKARELKAGDVLETHRGEVHRMTTHGACVSIHLYQGADGPYTIYDPERRTQWLVKPDTIASKPSPDAILSEKPWAGF